MDYFICIIVGRAGAVQAGTSRSSLTESEGRYEQIPFDLKNTSTL
jgi:hypothetical protein